MKRKLDVNGEPAEASGPVEAGPPSRPKPEEALSFADLRLDPRLLRAVAEQGYRTPTLVQQKAIPPALDGQDVLAKAKTGSGKTAAYLLPVLHAILRRKASDSSSLTAALILVPTRELASQVHREVDALSAFCAKDISAVRLSDKVSAAVQRSLLSSLPDIVIATPSRAWNNIATGALDLARLTHLVLDEADLVLSFGYQEDLQNVARSIPHPVQTILLSATLTAEVDTLKGIFCREPTLLDLVEQEPAGGDVSQYYVKCAEDEKFLLIYVIYKLKLIKGKTIIFVSDVDRCYRLKLFFEQFGLRSCVLNSELPVNSRIHVVEEFNKHVYDVIIASDEHEVLGDEDAQDAAEEEARNEAEKRKEAGDDKVAGGGDKDVAAEEDVAQDGNLEAGAEARPNAKARTKAKANGKANGEPNGKRKRGGEGDGERPAKRKRPARDKEYGVSRGIDFKNVSCVVNFDLPTSARSYTHRIGRTARAGQTGMALSFVIPPDKYRKHMATTVATAEHDDRVLGRIIRQQAKKGAQLGPYTFDMKQVDAFRYRMDDGLRAVTKVAVREARTRELRQELLKSEKLRRHFEENPAELHHLRHDGELRAARTQTHLRHVPDYLLPGGTKLAGGGEGGAAGFVPLRVGDKDRDRSRRRRGGGGVGSRGGGVRGKGNGGGKGEKSSSRKMDPLKSFKARRPKRP